MAISNPAFRNDAFTKTAPALTAQQLEELYNQPAAQRQGTTPETQPTQTPTATPVGGAMTVEDTVVKSIVSFAVLLVGAAVGWFTIAMVPGLWIGAALVGFVLAMVNIFKKEPSPALILAYAAAQGVFLGGISAFYEASMPGIVSQAVLATFCVVGVTLGLFATGLVRASKKLTRVFIVALGGYVLFSLVNVGLMLFGVSKDPWGLLTGVTLPGGIPLGIVLGIFAVLMGAYSLVLDFDFVQRGVRNQAPRKYGWTAAFGIMVTIIWLYLEILRLIAIARN